AQKQKPPMGSSGGGFLFYYIERLALVFILLLVAAATQALEEFHPQIIFAGVMFPFVQTCFVEMFGDIFVFHTVHNGCSLRTFKLQNTSYTYRSYCSYLIVHILTKILYNLNPQTWLRGLSHGIVSY